MVNDTAALAADTDTTGAPTGARPGSDLDRCLRLQRLELEDVEANRNGRISPRQAAIVGRQRTYYTTSLLLAFGAFFAVASSLAILDYVDTKRFGMFIAPGVALVLFIIAYVIYASSWRLPTAAEIAERKVVAVQGVAEYIGNWPHKGFYLIKVNGTSYKGYTAMDSSFRGRTVKIYVVPGDNIVVGMEPIDEELVRPVAR